MSYCRMGDDSDVHIYYSNDKMYVCCMCFLDAPDGYGEDFQCRTIDEMLMHLDEHFVAGHTVPQKCIIRLKEEKEEMRIEKQRENKARKQRRRRRQR